MPEIPRAPVLRRALLALCLALPGCVDALGVGSDCASEMSQIRREEGGGPQRRIAGEEPSGDFSERWEYTAPNRMYTFRWGASYAGCEVDGPVPFVRVPGDLPRF